MGRPRKPENAGLPPGVYRNRGKLYDRDGRPASAAVAGDDMAALMRRVLALKLRTISPSTAAVYRSCLATLSPMLADFTPAQVRGRDVADVKVKLSDTPGMANACLMFLSVCFDFALEHQLVDSHPCAGVRRYEPRKRKRCPTDAELQRLHGAASPMMRVLIELLVKTGQRVGDVLAIRRADIVDGGSAIRFRARKTGKRVTIHNPELRETIARANEISGNVRGMMLLANRYGHAPHYQTVYREWVELCRRAGVRDLHMHDLRAKSITAASKQGLDARGIAQHASESMTERYIRERDEPVVTGPSFGDVLDGPKQSPVESGA